MCYIIQEIYGIENKKDGNKDKVTKYNQFSLMRPMFSLMHLLNLTRG